MKSLTSVVIWTICLIIFGLTINSKLEKFCEDYTKKITTIEEQIKVESWSDANLSMEKYTKKWHREKDKWYKVLSHENFDDMSLYINILKEAIKEKDASLCFEQIEFIKRKLDMIIHNNKFDLNHIL